MVAVRQRRSSAPAVPNYTQADVEALSANEPKWLAESRLAACITSALSSGAAKAGGYDVESKGNQASRGE